MYCVAVISYNPRVTLKDNAMLGYHCCDKLYKIVSIGCNLTFLQSKSLTLGSLCLLLGRALHRASSWLSRLRTVVMHV